MCVRLTYPSLLLALVNIAVLTRAGIINETYNTRSSIKNAHEISTVAAINFIPKSVAATESPYEAITGMFSECLVQLSYSCFQRKLIVFLDRLDKQKKIKVYGDWFELVRVSEPHTPAITEDLLIARKANDEETLSSLLNLEWEQFVDNRIIRFHLPGLDDITEYDRRSLNYIDINVSGHTPDEVEGRGKKKKKKKLAKILKKVFLIIGKIAVIKLILLKPIILKLLLVKALLALLMGKMGFMMSAGMMLMKMMQNKSIRKWIGSCSCGGGKGGKGGCSCGGGDSYAPSGVSDVEWQGAGGGGGGGGWDNAGGGGGGGGWMSGGGGGGYDRSFSHNYAYSHYAPDSSKSDLTKGDTGLLSTSNSSHNNNNNNLQSPYYK